MATETNEADNLEIGNPTFENGSSVEDKRTMSSGAPGTSSPAVELVGMVGPPSGSKTTATDLETALRGLREGSVTEAEAMAVLERLMDDRIDARMAGIPGSLESTVKSIFARLTEAPTNWHQCIVFFLTSTAHEDATMRPWLPAMFAASWLMVLVQCAAAMGVAIGVVLPSCMSSDQCPSGQYCQVGFSNRCGYCGSNVPLYMQIDKATGDTYNAIFDPGFIGFNKTLVAQVCADPFVNTCGKLCPPENYYMPSGDLNGRTCGQSCDFNYEHNLAKGNPVVRDNIVIGFNSGGDWDLGYDVKRIEEWCNYCVHDITKDVDPVSQFGLLKDNVKAMGKLDWLAFFFACSIVSFQVVGEMKDIHLCTLALLHAPAEQLHPAWKGGLWALNMVRRWVFLTLLTISVPLLVVYKGGDALSVCFNTIAILFMTEVDNVCYYFALAERVRTRVEEAGRVELTEKEAAMLVRTKAIHVCLVVASCMFAVKMAGSSMDNPFIAVDRSKFGTDEHYEQFSNMDRMKHGPGGRFTVAMLVLIMAFWVGAVAEIFCRGLTPKEIGIHIATVTGARILSLAVMSAIGAGSTVSVDD
jgi:hypothetical protein